MRTEALLHNVQINIDIVKCNEVDESVASEWNESGDLAMNGKVPAGGESIVGNKSAVDLLKSSPVEDFSE